MRSARQEAGAASPLGGPCGKRGRLLVLEVTRILLAAPVTVWHRFTVADGPGCAVFVVGVC
jgi:hypothetical protein